MIVIIFINIGDQHECVPRGHLNNRILQPENTVPIMATLYNLRILTLINT